MVGRVIVFQVDAREQDSIAICQGFAGGADQNLLRAAIQVCLCAGTCGRTARTLNHQVDT
jgi:hypothetical protein